MLKQWLALSLRNYNHHLFTTHFWNPFKIAQQNSRACHNSWIVLDAETACKHQNDMISREGYVLPVKPQNHLSCACTNSCREQKDGLLWEWRTVRPGKFLCLPQVSTDITFLHQHLCQFERKRYLNTSVSLTTYKSRLVPYVRINLFICFICGLCRSGW